jgi:hypothetical protein
MTTGSMVLVTISVTMNPPNNAGANTCFAVTGATDRPIVGIECLSYQNGTGNQGLFRASSMNVVTGLTPGTNTFTMQYNSSQGSTTNFSNRNIAVTPLN